MKKNRSILKVLALACLLSMGACKKQQVPENGSATDTSGLSGALGDLGSPSGDVVGRITAGYQGWFLAAGDGSLFNSFQHNNLECWPDTREYTKTYNNPTFWQDSVVTTATTLGNGQPATLISDYDQSTVNTHFLWMQQYGVETVALQRFIGHFSDPRVKDQVNTVLTRVAAAAQTYARKYYVMYDCSATDPIVSDFDTYISSHTTEAAYAKQNSKPVICLYGIGKSDRGTTANWVTLINNLKAKGLYVIGATQGNFTAGNYLDAVNVCDMIMDWGVGRSQNYGFQSLFTTNMTYCNAHGLDYQADIYPGTAFSNSHTTGKSPRNAIKRNHGDYMWTQFVAAKNAGVPSIYISMFDEMNEATQIMKSAENSSQIPAGKYFLTLDADGTACSSDFYLRLTGDGMKMIRGQIPLVTTHPTPHTTTGGVTFYQNTTYGGTASKVIPIGNYTLAQIVGWGLQNDWASSVKVPAGLKVIMYSNDNFSGTAWTLTANTPSFPTLTPSANDVVSSIKVQVN